METWLLYCFLFLITISITNIPAAVHTNCIPDQRLSLLRFKKSLVFDSDLSSKLIAWNSSVDCCQWPGVTCSADGSVVGLDISGEAINCSIHDSSSLFDLHHLESLNLGSSFYNGIWNDFNGSQIPAAIGKLSNLRYLNLSDSDFSGQIPIEISHLRRLVTLHISSSYDLKLENPNLRKLVQNLTELEELNLDFVNISAHGTGWCQAISHSLPKLRVLSLRNTGISGPFHRSLAALKSLSVIKLDGINISSAVPEFFATFRNLTSLSLMGCQLLGTFPKEIFLVPSLQSIILTANPNLDVSLPDFSKNESLLSEVDISGCAFSGSLPASIGNLTHLVHLHMSSNQFIGQVDSIHWENLVNLQYLDLGSNLLNGSIPSSLFSLPSLRELFLLDNQFSGPFPELANISSYLLESVDLSSNNLEGAIPNWIWNIDSLWSLNLACNSIEIVESPSLGSSSVVTKLDLHSNQIQGPITFLLPSLRYLDYSQNNLSSSIPTFIGDLTDLVFLSLSGNNLKGHIPVSICNASLLVFLDLSNNSMSGGIPKCLSQFPPKVLDLRKNNFSGIISNFEFSKDCKLRTLSLSGNEIEGRFPKSIINCTQLEVLDIGNNQIRDAFPCVLKSLSTLSVLILRFNKFYGSIECPETKGTWPVLQILDLAHNNLDGEIPGASLTTWHAMVLPNREYGNLGVSSLENVSNDRVAYLNYEDVITATSKGLEMNLVAILNVFTLIDLSENKFNGSIPKELGEFKSLYVLNFSSNCFTGEIPSSFGNMKQLESLDLSKNNLGGQIPPQLTELTFLEVLDLSSNQLVGRIPTSTQFSTFPKASFQGNKNLWGPPLTVDKTSGLSPKSPQVSIGNHSNSRQEIDWTLISAEVGYACGFGTAIGSLLFCKKWRIWYFKAMYNLLLKVFPQLEEIIGNHRRHVYTGQSHWRR